MRIHHRKRSYRLGYPATTPRSTGEQIVGGIINELGTLINGVIHPIDTIDQFLNNVFGGPIFSENGANSGDKHPSTPTGQRGSPIEVKPGTNEPTSIGGRNYTGHALDRMQGRCVPPSAVEDAIRNGTRSPGNQTGTTVHTGSNGVTVVIGNGGRGISVIPR